MVVLLFSLALTAPPVGNYPDAPLSITAKPVGNGWPTLTTLNIEGEVRATNTIMFSVL